MAPMQSRTLMVAPESDQSGVDPQELEFQQLKVDIHEKLVDSLDLSMLAHVPQQELELEVREIAAEVIVDESRQRTISEGNRERLLDEIFDEAFGLGPLERLMQDDEISDILVNHPHEVFVERHGQIKA